MPEADPIAVALLLQGAPKTEPPIDLVFGADSFLTDLVFRQPQLTEPPIDLVFGGGETPDIEDVEGVLTGTLPALTFAARAGTSAEAGFAATLPGLVAALRANYLSDAARPTVASTSSLWQYAEDLQAGPQIKHDVAALLPTGRSAMWQQAQPIDIGTDGRFDEARTQREQVITSYQQGVGARQPARGTHQEARRDFRRAISASYEAGIDTRPEPTTGIYQDGIKRRTERATGWAPAVLRRAMRGAGYQTATDARLGFRTAAQNGRPPKPGVPPVPPQPPPFDPCYIPPLGDEADLVFLIRQTSSAALLFYCERHGEPPQDPVLIPIRRVYFVINHVTLHRLPDGLPVPVFSLSLSLDAASWAWGFEAQAPGTAEPLLSSAFGPVELVASVNGRDFRVLAEQISRERSFGESSIRISGRGHNAKLAAPYAPTMTFTNTQARSARQLMDDVLTNDGTQNGVSLGWSVDSSLTDWIVPAGVFSKQGTWLEALNAIATAAGGYLLPHPAEQHIRVRHRFPAAPWEWGEVIPDIILPADAVLRESLQWRELPAYERVFVSGQHAGVLAQVTRAGTAGQVLAPMVVDPLITEAAAARQRGLAVLADAGRQIEASLRLPLFQSTGLIEPGAFVEYREGSVQRLGLVRSTRVDAQIPQVWQTLGIQAYA